MTQPKFQPTLESFAMENLKCWELFSAVCIIIDVLTQVRKQYRIFAFGPAFVVPDDKLLQHDVVPVEALSQVHASTE